MPLCSLEEALDDLKAGKFVVVVDDERRENEGDLVMPAEMVNPRSGQLHGYPRPRPALHADDLRAG